MSSLILASSLHYVKTWRRPQNRKHIKYCTDVRGGPAMATDNRRYRRSGEIWTCRFWDTEQRLINRQVCQWRHWPISKHADPMKRRISSMKFTLAHLYGNVYIPLGMACTLADSCNFGLLGEQSSQNLWFPALDADEPPSKMWCRKLYFRRRNLYP